MAGEVDGKFVGNHGEEWPGHLELPAHTVRLSLSQPPASEIASDLGENNPFGESKDLARNTKELGPPNTGDSNSPLLPRTNE